MLIKFRTVKPKRQRGSWGHFKNDDFSRMFWGKSVLIMDLGKV